MDEQITLQEYIDGVEKSLQYWLDLHTDAKTWAEEWTLDDIQWAFKESPTIKNSYFTFDWKRAAYKQYAKVNRHWFICCKNCGCIFENGYEDSCCDNPKFVNPPKLADLIEWLSELELELSDDVLYDALEKDGFKTYRIALKDTIAPVVSEVKMILRAIRKARTNQDKLVAVLWGTRVYHVNGNIMSDYGDRTGLDYKMVDSIRNNGLESIFSKDEVSEFVNS